MHSSNNIQEFLYQTSLILGVDSVRTILNGSNIPNHHGEKDLEGTDGWDSYERFFDIANMCSNYLVQRGFESLPETNPGANLDLITGNYQRLMSAVGAFQIENQP